MEILLWLVPPALVTVVAMAWVSWLGREGRGEVDREAAIQRLGEALEGRPRRLRRSRSAPGYAVTPTPRDRSTGIAVRASRPARADTQHPSTERRAS